MLTVGFLFQVPSRLSSYLKKVEAKKYITSSSSPKNRAISSLNYINYCKRKTPFFHGHQQLSESIDV